MFGRLHRADDHPASPSLSAQLLGAPELRHAGRRFVIPRHKNRVLFYVLAARPMPVSRDALHVLLWPEADEGQARRALTQALTQIRADLPDSAALGQTKEAVWLDRALVRSDVDEVDRLASRPPSDRSTGDLEALVALCRGRFLEGIATALLPDLEDWIHAEAERLERHVLEALAELTRRHTDAGLTREATLAARRYLSIDPFDERMHRRLMALLAAADDRNAAIVHYRRCVAALQRELGVAPEAATRAAYATVVGDRRVMAVVGRGAGRAP